MTDSDLQVVAGGLWQGLAEPERVIELAAGAGGTAACTVPQRVIGEEDTPGDAPGVIATITEIVISDK